MIREQHGVSSIESQHTTLEKGLLLYVCHVPPLIDKLNGISQITRFWVA